MLTFKVQVDVCIAVTEWIEGVAPVDARVGEAGVFDGQGQHVAMLLGLQTLVGDARVLLDDLLTKLFWKFENLEEKDNIFAKLKNNDLFWDAECGKVIRTRIKKI